MDQSELVDQFCTVTGVTDKEVAKNYIEACNGNVEMAISMQMDNAEQQPLQNDCPHRQSKSDGGESVRAPIPQKQEVLVEHDTYLLEGHRKRKRATNPNSVFDKFRDFQAEARQQENLLKNGGSPRTKIAVSSVHLTKLEDLFRPPLDIIHHGSLISAQAKAKLENKWVLVNIQNTEEFACQVLNRDIWKDPSVRELVIKHFILWQVYNDSTEGQKYMQFYPVTSWPYISIVHPVTAELLKSWNTVKLKDFEQDLREFVLLHCKPDGTEASLNSNTDSPAKFVDPALDASEESQLEAAIQASLKDANKKESHPLIFDSDSDEVETFTDSEEETQAKGKKLVTGVAPKKSSTQHTQSLSSNGDGEDLSPRTKHAKLDSKGWKDYTSEEGTDVSIMLKKPDQSRCQWCVKSMTKIQALILYVESLGFNREEYEIVANFPRRKISELAPDKNFGECGFQKQETLYIQQR